MKRQIASLIVLAGLLCASTGWAEGTITHFSGPVSVRKADGQVLPASTGAKLAVDDTVITGAGGYTRVEMTDGGEMVLRPDSQLKIDAYNFVEATPAEDSFLFSVLKGGMRTMTGLIGKRGNRDAYQLRTVTATIGIRGTQFDLRVCQANCGALIDGTYLAVKFGAVQTSNAAGTLTLAAGQVGFVPSQSPPVILPRDPGIGFTPPPVIPRVDERRRQPAPASSTAPDQAKPAASDTGQGSTQKPAPSGAQSGSSDSGGAKSEDTKTDGSKTEGSKADGTKSEGGASGTGGNEGGAGDTGAKPAPAVDKPGAAAPQGSSTNSSALVSSATNVSAANSSTLISPATNAFAPTAAPQPAAGMDCSVQ